LQKTSVTQGQPFTKFYGGVKSYPRTNHSDVGVDPVQDPDPGFLNPVLSPLCSPGGSTNALFLLGFKSLTLASSCNAKEVVTVTKTAHMYTKQE